VDNEAVLNGQLLQEFFTAGVPGTVIYGEMSEPISTIKVPDKPFLKQNILKGLEMEATDLVITV
jgi:hypothetical protein